MTPIELHKAIRDSCVQVNAITDHTTGFVHQEMCRASRTIYKAMVELELTKEYRDAQLAQSITMQTQAADS